MWISSQTTAKRDQLLTDLTSSETARGHAWRHWGEHLPSIGISDNLFLDKLTHEDTHQVFGCFAQAMQERCFHEVRFGQLQESTVHSTMDDVAQIFRAHYRDDPRVDQSGKLAHLLYHQFQGYQNLDPGVKLQKALTASILCHMCSLATTEVDKTINSLVISAFFFAMRFYKYSTTKGVKHTKLLTLGNIKFFYGRQEISHSLSQIMRADTVSISFEDQKCDECTASSLNTGPAITSYAQSLNGLP